MSGKMWREYVNDPMACRDLALQVGMGLMQCCMLFCLPPLMMIMPGLMSLFVMAVCWAMNMAMCYPLNDGSRVNRVVPEGVSVRALEEMADEEWVFVGGMMTRYVSSFHNQAKSMKLT